MDPTALRAFSHDELLERTRKLAESERRISVAILHHLAEIDRRRAFAKLGYGSLWDYTLKELKYSEGAAYRRISAMRALCNHPELEGKIQKGDLSVSTVSQVQSFLKSGRETANMNFSKEEKAAIFRNCESKSSREVTRELLAISPIAFKVQKERAITENRTEIRFIVDTELLSKIHRVRDLSVSRLRDPASYPELVDFMSEVTLDEIDPLRKPVREPKPDKNTALITPKATDSVKRSRWIPESVRRRVWQECGGKCAFVDSVSGRRCNSTFGLEIEHCQPYSMGGSSTDPENLRLLCRKHNQWQAIQTYGLEKMESHLKS
jgi:5-methylcytosine-specific restriction endonuclease McrA